MIFFLLKLKCLQRALSSCELKWRSGRSLASDEKFGRSKTDLSSSCSRLLDALDNQPRSRLPLTFSRSTRFQNTFLLFVLLNSRLIFIKQVLPFWDPLRCRKFSYLFSKFIFHRIPGKKKAMTGKDVFGLETKFPMTNWRSKTSERPKTLKTSKPLETSKTSKQSETLKT